MKALILVYVLAQFASMKVVLWCPKRLVNYSISPLVFIPKELEAVYLHDLTKLASFDVQETSIIIMPFKISKIVQDGLCV